jgi:hypothetical protein
MGLGILMEPSSYNDSAPDGAEDATQPMALNFKSLGELLKTN